MIIFETAESAAYACAFLSFLAFSGISNLVLYNSPLLLVIPSRYFNENRIVFFQTANTMDTLTLIKISNNFIFMLEHIIVKK